MTKLYDLVKFRNYLMNQIDHLSLEKPIQEKIENLGKIKNLFPQHADYCDTTIKDYLSLAQQSQAVIDGIRKQISRLDLEIDMLSTSMFDSDEYRDMMSESKIQGEQFANNLIISAELEAEIISKITEYSNLLYPALQINPKSKKWIDPMVAGARSSGMCNGFRTARSLSFCADTITAGDSIPSAKVTTSLGAFATT